MAASPLVYCIGEALWDLHSSPSTALMDARSLRLEPGGAAVLVAMRLARAGIAVGLAAAVGDDPLGHALRDRVARAGVDVRAISLVPARTPLLFIGHPKNGGRELVGYRRLEDEVIVGPRAAARPKIVHIASISPSPSHARAITAIGRRFRERGAVVTVDINARPRVWRDASKRDRARLPAIAGADLVKASADDLEVIGMGEGIRAIARMRVRMRPDATLLVTRGEGPITAHGPFGVIERKTKPMGNVDPTGAGDALMAGVIASILASPPLDATDPEWIELAIARGIAFARARLKK